ncbi:ArsR/SmtB family transcription factor [Streptomyces sp. NBC_00448]|uniref:ArsR/SmtB family transcription factor n=1 Tax=Streptomyces sp. NBC_00448 TaxID=2903652 RepID=UPI002E238BD2
MSQRMRFTAEELLRCRFAISPLREAQGAIRTLSHPDRHGYHLPWLRQVRTVAAGLDLIAFWLLTPGNGHGPDFLHPVPAVPLAALEDETAAIRATDPEVARQQIARALAQTPGARDSRRGRAMLADPAGTVRQLAGQYEHVWSALLAPHWPRLRAVLEADVAYHARRLADGGMQRLFTGLHPLLNWSEGALSVGGGVPEKERLPSPSGGLVLVPSVFFWPEASSAFDPPWQPTVVYPARGVGGLWARTGPSASDALVRLLGANRAAILSGLDAPTTTTALAHRHDLAMSSVSAHLAVLRDAGLLRSRRYGHQVLYERTPLGIAMATGGLL